MRESSRERARWEWGGLGVLVAFFLVVRVVFFVGRAAEPDFGEPAIDAGFHDTWARSILDADFEGPANLGDPRIGSTPYLRPPGFPLLLAASYGVSGGSDWAPRVVNGALGLLTLSWVVAVGRRGFGGAAGLLGGALFVLAWVPLYFEGELHAVALLGCLLMGMVWAILWHGDRPGFRRALLVGGLLGLAAITRPNALAGLPLVAFVLWRQGQRGEVPGVRGSLAALGLGLALAIAPVTIRNWTRGGEPVLITTGAGINLFLGNSDGATGMVGASIPGIGVFETCYDYPALVEGLEAKTGVERDHRGVSAWFRDEALAWIREHPGRALGLMGTKAALLLGAHEVAHNKDLEEQRRQTPLLRGLPVNFPSLLGFGILAWVGLLLGWSRHAVTDGPTNEDGAAESIPTRRAAGELTFLGLGLVLVFVLSLLPFFAAARYRAPLLPLLAPLAGGGLVLAATSLRSATLPIPRRWAPALLGLALAGCLHIPWVSFPTDGSKWHHDRGIAYAKAGDDAHAIESFQAAVAIRPHHADALYSLALARQRQGRLPAAERNYRLAIEARPEHLGALNNLGILLAQTQRIPEARTLFERARTLVPHHTESHINLATTYEMAGDLGSARRVYEEALKSGAPPNARLWSGLIRACEGLGDRDAAEDARRRATTRP